MGENKCDFSHAVFVNNPIQFRSYVHKYVEVETTEGDVHKGTLYTIDPVSESVVLVNKNEDKLSMDIIMGHAVKSLQIKKSCEEAPVDVFLKKDEEMPSGEIERRKGRLAGWLQKNRTPVEEDGQILRIGSVVEIHPPYGVDSCLSSNEIILDRIQKLMLSMPDNYDLGT
ncbi:gem-associated protein 6-like [Schistocerca cancellata]|uniref:gem-associated protein 6-like n=1 Tax=Schistocerca cancellata TaxID=274614 RepID=UPI002118C1D5|nr:gem-associated protein 6-like [Schistocerca cancellata]